MSLTPEQLVARRDGIGSSDIAAIAGVDKYRNAIDVFNEKVFPVEQTEGAATGRNPARWGHRLEGLVVEEWADLKNIKCYIRSPGTIFYPKNKLFFATPDALALNASLAGKELTLAEVVAGAEGLCEAKAPGLRVAEDWADDEAPEWYLVQTQWQAGVIGVQQAELCALIGGQDFRMRTVTPDTEIFGDLVDIGAKFWRDHVLTKKVPPLDHSKGAAEYIRRRFGKAAAAGMQVLADDHPTMALARQFEKQIRLAKAEGEAAKVIEDAGRNRLKELVGETAGIEGVCTFNRVQKDSYVVEAQDYRELRLARQKKEKKK